MWLICIFLGRDLNCSAGGSSSHVVIECDNITAAASLLCSFDEGPQHMCKYIHTQYMA